MKVKASWRAGWMAAAGVFLCCVGPLHAQEATQAAPPAAAQPATAPNPLQQLFGIKPAPAAAEPAAAAAEPTGRPLSLNKYRKTSAHRGHWRKAARTHRARHDATAEAKAAPEAKTTSEAKTTPDAKASAKAEVKPEIKPAAVADADNATPVPVAETPAADNAAPPASETTAAKPEAAVVAADELNEVDRAMAAQPAGGAAQTGSAARAEEHMPTLALASVNAAEPVTTGQAASAGDDNSSWARASLIGKIFIGFGGLLTLASALRMLIA